MSRGTTIRDIAAEIRRLEHDKAAIDTRLDNLRGALEHFESLAAETDVEGPSSTAEVISDGAHACIMAAGRPLHRRDIRYYLAERDIVVAGKDPLGNLSAYLSRDRRFVSLGKGIWDIRGRMLPPRDHNGKIEEAFDAKKIARIGIDNA